MTFADVLDWCRKNHADVRGVYRGKEQEPSTRFAFPANPPARPYLPVPIQTLPGHTPNDAAVGDLDGDGEYEIVLKQEQRPRDNSQKGTTGETKLEAYKLDGTFRVVVRVPIPICAQGFAGGMPVPSQ